MGYHIIYDGKGKECAADRRMRRLAMTGGFFLCFLWLVCIFWQEGREILKILLIPGDPEHTIQAAEVFAQELGSGFSLGDAARNFCISVLNYGYSG